MKFIARDGLESRAFGKDTVLNCSYQLRDIALKRITVIKNNILIVGLKFTYIDDETDTF